MPALTHAGGLLGAGGVEERGRRRAAARRCRRALAALTTSLARIGVGQRLTVVADRAVDDLDVGSAEAARRRRVLALGDDDVGAAPAARRRARSAARGRRGRRRRRRRARLADCLRWSREVVTGPACSVVSSSRLAASRRLSIRSAHARAARPRGRGRAPSRRRRVDRWRTAGPSRSRRCDDDGAQVELRDRRSPSASVGERADRGGAAGLEGGEQGALGGHGEPGWPGRRAAPSGGAQLGVVGPGTRRPARPGRGRAASGSGRGPR